MGFKKMGLLNESYRPKPKPMLFHTNSMEIQEKA